MGYGMDTQYTIETARADHPLWFEAGAMDFFGTQLIRQWPLESSVWFVTSEQPPHGGPWGPNTWNVRHSDKAECDTVGQDIATGWPSLEVACTVAETLAMLEYAGRLVRRPIRLNPVVRCTICQQGATDQLEHVATLAEYELDGNPICSLHVPFVAGALELVAAAAEQVEFGKEGGV